MLIHLTNPALKDQITSAETTIPGLQDLEKGVCRCFKLPPMSKILVLCLARMVYLEDMRFILVRTESPYVQFVVAAHVTSTESL